MLAGMAGTHTLRAYVMRLTSHMPAGDMRLNGAGHDVHGPVRFHTFVGMNNKYHSNNN